MKYLICLLLLLLPALILAESASDYSTATCRVVGSEVQTINSDNYKPLLHVDLFQGNSVILYSSSQSKAQKDMSDSVSTYSTLSSANNWRNSYNLASNYTCYVYGSKIVMDDPELSSVSSLLGLIIAMSILGCIVCCPVVAFILLVIFMIMGFTIGAFVITLLAIVLAIFIIIVLALLLITCPVWGPILVLLCLGLLGILALVGVGFGIFYLIKNRDKIFSSLFDEENVASRAHGSETGSNFYKDGDGDTVSVSVPSSDSYPMYPPGQNPTGPDAWSIASKDGEPEVVPDNWNIQGKD